MLDKLVVNLKNIIFFKFIVYCISIVLMIGLLPIVRNELTRTENNYSQSVKLLEYTSKKINSLQRDKYNKKQLSNAYEELLMNSAYHTCMGRKELIHSIKVLGEQFGLVKPIEVNMSKIFLDNDTQNTNLTKIKVNNYELSIILDAADLENLLTISQAIYALLPSGSIVSATEIRENESISPQILMEMANNTVSKVELFHYSMKIIIREIVYVE